MKKLILIFLAASTMLSAYSQTEKGKNSIGGSLNLNNDINKNSSDVGATHEDKNFHLSIIPEFGWFIKDNLEVGVNLNYSYYNYSYDSNNSSTYSTYSNSDQNKISSYGLGVFAKKYYNITDKLKFFINGNLNYQYRINDNNQSSTQFFYDRSDSLASITQNSEKQEKSNVIGLSFAPGLVYFVTPKLGIQASFGQIAYSYSKSTQKDDASYSGSDNNLTISLTPSSLYLGIKYYY